MLLIPSYVYKELNKIKNILLILVNSIESEYLNFPSFKEDLLGF